MNNGYQSQEETFITGLRGEEGKTPAYMTKVRLLNDQLQDAVTNMSDNVGILLKEREKDFLAAYRHHMYTVQQELQDAKEKVHQADMAMKNNDQMKKLRKERDWFRGEAIRLDNLTEGMRKDLEVIHEKVESIEEDRTWLESQLKSSKKQIKALRSEVEADARARTSWGGSGEESNRQSNVGSRSGIMGSRNSLPMVSNTPSPRMDHIELSAGRERKYKEQIKLLRKQLKQEQKQLREIRLIAVNEQSTSSELEEFLLMAIDDVKRDVAKRKANTLLQIARSGSQSPQRRRGRDKRGAVKMEDELPSLQELYSVDRVNVIKKLLEKDEVLAFIYNSLFPEYTK